MQLKATKKRILHIESDNLMLKIVKYVFRGQEIEIIATRTIQDSLTILKTQAYQFDLVIIELFLAAENNYQIIDDLSFKGSNKTQLIVTRNARTAPMIENVDATLNDYFFQPSIVKALFNKINIATINEDSPEYLMKDLILVTGKIKPTEKRSDHALGLIKGLTDTKIAATI